MAKICKTLATYREMIKGTGISDIDLNPLNSKLLLAYTRQWDKICDTSCFTAKNTEFLSYFLVFTLLETVFMQ